MLNHRWEVWDYWPSRNEHVHEISVEVPHGVTDLEKARKIMSQIDFAGNLILHYFVGKEI